MTKMDKFKLEKLNILNFFFQMSLFNSRWYRIQERTKTEEHTLTGFCTEFTLISQLTKVKMAELKR